MSDTLYRPPQALVSDDPGLGYEGSGSFAIGLCLSDAWRATWRSIFPWLVGCVLAVAGVMVTAFVFAATLALFVPFGVLVGALLYLGLFPLFTWGFVQFNLNAFDGRARVGDLFSGFAPPRGRAVLLSLTFFAISAPTYAAQAVDALGANRVVHALAILLMLAWFVLVLFRVYFATLFLVDRDQGVLESIANSWRVTRGQTASLLLLALLTGLIPLAGVLALGVGVIPAALMATQVWVSAYRQMAGRPGPRAAPVA